MFLDHSPDEPGPLTREIMAVDDVSSHERIRIMRKDPADPSSTASHHGSAPKLTAANDFVNSAAANLSRVRLQPSVTRQFSNNPKIRNDERFIALNAYRPPLWSRNSPAVNTTKGTVHCTQTVRQKRIKDACDIYTKSQLPIANKKRIDEAFIYRFMLVDEKHKTMYCEVPKAACTSWKVFLANITGKVQDKDQKRLHQLVHDTEYHPKIGFRYLNTYSAKERKHILRTYFKFLVVRNPYTRFLSAYENKFKGENVQAAWYHQHMGKDIIKKYRKGVDMKKIKGDEVTFEELARVIGNPHEHMAQRYDGHFWKQHASCYPCIIDYDYIGKVETMEEDSAEIISRIVPSMDLHLPFLNKNKNSAHERKYVHDAYSQLPDDVITALSAIYAEDAETFGYTMDGNHHINCNSAAEGEEQCC